MRRRRWPSSWSGGLHCPAQPSSGRGPLTGRLALNQALPAYSHLILRMMSWSRLFFLLDWEYKAQECQSLVHFPLQLVFPNAHSSLRCGQCGGGSWAALRSYPGWCHMNGYGGGVCFCSDPPAPGMGMPVDNQPFAVSLGRNKPVVCVSVALVSPVQTEPFIT